MEPNDLITLLVEGSSSSNVFRYEEAPFSNANLVGDALQNLDVGVIVVNSGVTSDPQKTLDLVYQNQKDGWGFMTLPKRDALILVEDTSDGANLYYASDDTILVEKLTETFGETVNSEPGLFFLENINTLKENLEAAPAAEVLPPPIAETETSTNSVALPVVKNSNVGADIVFGLLAFLVIAWGVYRINKMFHPHMTITNVAKKKKKKKPKKKTINFKGVSDAELLSEQLGRLSENIRLHEVMASDTPYGMADDLKRIEKDFSRLWKLAEKEESAPIVKQKIAIEYGSTFQRLNRLVGFEYWGDLVTNPQDFRAPKSADVRLADIRTAVGEVEAQLLKNIQQLKENNMLEFEIDLELLRGPGDLRRPF